MGITTPSAALRQPSVNVRVRMEVEKDVSGNWLDLTDRIAHDRLISAGEIASNEERGLGAFDVTVGNLVLDDSDGFWHQPPTGITSWFRHRVRLSLVTAGGTQAMGMWMVQGLVHSADGGQVTLTLASLSKRLVDKQADRVRDGQDWYTNRPIGWLVRELLLQEHKRTEVTAWGAAGKLLTRYRIPLADPNARAISHFGRPPEFDGAVWRDASSTVYGSPMCAINDAASPHNGKVLVGIEAKVWLWDPATDLWTDLGGFYGAEQNFRVMHLWWVNHSPTNSHYYVGVGWEPDRPTGATDTGHRSGAKNGSVKFFYGLYLTTTWALYTGEPANIWTGHYGIRIGGYPFVDTTILGGQSTVGDTQRIGANVPWPASHWVRYRESASSGPPYSSVNLKKMTAWNSSTRDLTTPLNLWQSPAYWGLEIPGFWSWVDTYAPGRGDIRPLDARFSIGQRAGAFALETYVSGDYGRSLHFFVVSWDAGTKHHMFRFWKLDTYTGVFSNMGRYTVQDAVNGSESQQPYAMLCDPASTNLWVAGASWGERVWSGGAPQANEVLGMIYRHTHTLTSVGTGTKVWDSATADAAYRDCVPIEICFGGNNSWLAVAHFDLKKMAGNPYFVAMHYVVEIPSLQINKTRYSRGRPSGLVRDSVAQRIYWHEEGANVLVSVPHILNTTDAQVEDYGLPPVEGDPNLCAGLVYCASEQALYGISGYGAGIQSDATAMDGPPVCKQYLWQFDNHLTDRIEIADFSDMTVWESLSALARVGDFLFGYDGSGDFFFKVRPAPTTVVGTIRARLPFLDGVVPTAKVTKDWGFGEVYNVVEITPGKAILGKPDGTVQAIPRASGFNRDLWDGDPQVYQQNVRAQNIFLRCVQGGVVGTPDDGCMAQDAAGLLCVDFSPTSAQRYHRLRFAWLLYDRVVESQLLAAVLSAGTSMVIPYQHAVDIWADVGGSPVVRRGDIVKIADGAERTVVAVSHSISAGQTTVTVDAAWGAGYAVGTHVVIRSFGNNRWSNSTEGVTETSAAWATSSEGAEEEKQFRDIRHLTVGMVLRIVSSAGVEDVRVTVISDAAAKKVKVKRGAAGTGTYAHPIGAVVQAFWAPIQNTIWPAGTLFAVGGTGVSLRINLPAAEKPFAVGDQVEIICPGLRLEEQELSKAMAFNNGSIERFGKMPWGAARETRFLTFRQGIESAGRIAAAYGWPHFLLALDGPLTLVPVGGDCWLLEDPLQLPAKAGVNPNGNATPVLPDTGTGIGVVIRGFGISLLDDRLRLAVRAVNRHQW